MPFWNKFPYTDFHELNLDWIISKVGQIEKNLKETLEAMAKAITAQEKAEEAQGKAEEAQENAETAETNAETAETNTREYYNNLVTHIAEDVTGWLDDNVNPVGSAVTVDSSLTISGSAADAKVTGDEFDRIKNEIISHTIKYNEHNNIINLPGLNGKYETIQTRDARRLGNIIYVNGNFTATNERLPLTGSELTISDLAPSYASVPNWYVTDIPGFIVGHSYSININKITGTEEFSTATETVITLRNSDSTLNVSTGNGTIFNCNYKPEMVCFVLPRAVYTNCIYSIEIVDITQEKKDIEDGANTPDYIIPYYFESNLTQAKNKINIAINSNKTHGTYGSDIESFVFITDIHWRNNKQHSPALIRNIMNGCPINTVICGGDFIANHNPTKEGAVAEVKSFTDAITEIPCHEYFSVFGNHDDNSIDNSDISTIFTKQEQYNILYAPFANNANVHWIWEDVPSIYNDTVVKCDYYVDHPFTKTRYLCIDWNHPYSTDRRNWIVSVLNKNDGYRVIIIYHGIYANSNGVLTPEHTEIMNIIEPYKNKIVALFTGHAHIDSVQDYYGDGSVPVIITQCDTYSTTAGSVENTVNEQCFDVAVIDYGQSVIKLTRIGRGNDRTVPFNIS